MGKIETEHYTITWRIKDEDEPERPALVREGFYDAQCAASLGVFEVQEPGRLVSRDGDEVLIEPGERVRVLVGNDLPKYGDEEWVYVVKEPLKVLLLGEVESIRPNTLVAVLPQFLGSASELRSTDSLGDDDQRAGRSSV